MHPVAIIGTSLAGLSAARALLKGGVNDFLLFDSKSNIGHPLKCGEAVDARTFELLYGSNIRKACFVRNQIDTHRVFWKQDFRSFKARYYELDRPEFEQWLAIPLRSHLVLGTRITHVEREQDGFCISSRHKSFQARSIILCCGADYGLHKQLGILRNDPELGYAFGGLYPSGGVLPLSQFFWDLDEKVEGYAWSFPKLNGIVNIGVAGFNPHEIRKSFEAFQNRFQVRGERLCVLGGHFPASGPIRKTYDQRILVCGDAAGMVFAGTGEGIAYALLSGEYAGQVMAEAVIENDFSRWRLREYETLWKESFGRKLKMGVRFKRLLLYLEKSGGIENVLKHTPDSVFQTMMDQCDIPIRVMIRYLYKKYVRVLTSAFQRRFSLVPI